MDRLSQRFPPGLHIRGQLRHDDVRARDDPRRADHAGRIAFVLVVIVVFLFLGSLRATIIPAIAVPVSVIGTFAVLLVLGYSANTVSLLAMVLAIGILVDDAIVVVENVERVMEEEPRFVAGAGDEEGNGRDHCADHRDHPGAAFGVRADCLYPRHSGQLFRQFAVTISVAMLISALNALTLSPALCAVFLRHRGQRRGPMAWVLRRIDNIRDGYAAIVRRLVRVSRVSASLLIAASAVAIWAWRCARRPGFCRRRIRAPFSSRCNCRTAPRSPAPARRSAASRQAAACRCRRSQKVFAIVGFSIIDSVNEPNAGFIVAALEAVRGPRAARRTRRRR